MLFIPAAARLFFSLDADVRDGTVANIENHPFPFQNMNAGEVLLPACVLKQALLVIHFTEGVFSLKKIAFLLTAALLWTAAPTAAAEPAVNARSALLMDFGSGTVLWEQNADEPLPPASVTKVMTLLLTMEAIDRGEIGYDTVVTASERAKSMGGSTIFLDANEQMTVDDLLKGIAVASGNDACVAVAEHLAGSVEAFVERMNQRAAELGMANTHFVNCNGLDAEGHYSSARDIALMSRELMKHNGIFRYTTIWMDSLRDGKFQLANTNKLIRFYDGATGLKTGSTDGALCCVSATAKRDDLHLIAVVMGSPDSKSRFASARAMLDYGFANYRNVRLGEKDKVVTTATVKKGVRSELKLVSADDAYALLSADRVGDVKTRTELEPDIHAPVRKGEELGQVVAELDGGVLARCRLVAAEDVERRGVFSYFRSLMECFMMP